MSLILAIEPDRDQAEQIAAIVRGRLGGELVVADAGAAGVRALHDRIPDLILTPALLPPKDEMVLTGWLRDLGQTAAHVQTLAVPILRSERGTPRESGGIFGRRRPHVEPGRGHGCDPDVFADQMQLYLARAAQERTAREAARTEVAPSATAEERVTLDAEPLAAGGTWPDPTPRVEPQYDRDVMPPCARVVQDEINAAPAPGDKDGWYTVDCDAQNAIDEPLYAREQASEMAAAPAALTESAVYGDADAAWPERLSASEPARLDADPVVEYEAEPVATAASSTDPHAEFAAAPEATLDAAVMPIDAPPAAVPEMTLDATVMPINAAPAAVPEMTLDPAVMSIDAAPAVDAAPLPDFQNIPAIELVSDFDSVPGLDAFSDVDLLAALNAVPSGHAMLDGPAAALDSYLDDQAAAWDPQLPSLPATEHTFDTAALTQDEPAWVPMPLEELPAEEPAAALCDAGLPAHDTFVPDPAPIAPAVSTALAPVHVPSVVPVQAPLAAAPAGVGVAVAVNVNGGSSQRVAVDVSVSVNSATAAVPAVAPRKRLESGPPQDEWGFFDPEQCGFAALMARLDEVATDEHGRTTRRTGTQVRVVSYS